MSKQHGVPTIKVNVDDLSPISEKYAISAMPTFKIIDNKGAEVDSLTGANKGKLEVFIVKAKGLLWSWNLYYLEK